MRLKIGENFNIFNEHDGEWSVELSEFNKKISKVKIMQIHLLIQVIISWIFYLMIQ